MVSSNILRFGLESGYIGIENSRIFFSGSEVYTNENEMEVYFSSEDKQHISKLLRKMARFLESEG